MPRGESVVECLKFSCLGAGALVRSDGRSLMLIKIKSGEAAEPKLLDLRYVTVHAYLLDPRQLGESATDTHVSNDLSRFLDIESKQKQLFLTGDAPTKVAGYGTAYDM